MDNWTERKLAIINHFSGHPCPAFKDEGDLFMVKARCPVGLTLIKGFHQKTLDTKAIVYPDDSLPPKAIDQLYAAMRHYFDRKRTIRRPV